MKRVCAALLALAMVLLLVSCRPKIDERYTSLPQCDQIVYLKASWGSFGPPEAYTNYCLYIENNYVVQDSFETDGTTVTKTKYKDCGLLVDLQDLFNRYGIQEWESMSDINCFDGYHWNLQVEYADGSGFQVQFYAIFPEDFDAFQEEYREVSRRYAN